MKNLNDDLNKRNELQSGCLRYFNDFFFKCVQNVLILDLQIIKCYVILYIFLLIFFLFNKFFIKTLAKKACCMLKQRIRKKFVLYITYIVGIYEN